MSRKKKKDIKRKNITLFIVSGILLLFLVAVFIVGVLSNKTVIYKTVSRVENLSKKTNEDKSGFHYMSWLKVQGTNIDLPILRALKTNTEDEKYPMQKEKYGWTLGEDDSYHNVINIMGHNLLNLSANPIINDSSFYRFEDIMSFVYFDFAKKNKYIQYTIDGKEYTYKIFAASFLYPLDVELLPKTEYTKDQKKDYIKLMKYASIYDYDVSVSEADDLIAIMTCTRMFGLDGTSDFMIVGRKVHEGEKLTNYKVSKNKNYEKVEKAMKGDDLDEKES